MEKLGSLEYVTLAFLCGVVFFYVLATVADKKWRLPLRMLVVLCALVAWSFIVIN